MWGIGYNPPAQNFGIEIWVLPQDNGIAGGSGGWIFSSGQSGGVALRINAPSGLPSYIDAYDVGNSTTIGDQVIIDTNVWMELAIVNAGGVTTFYTNGIPCGSSVTNGTTTSAGDVYIGSPNDNSAYDGYLDEARMFTFSAGAFTTNDLLLRPAGPNVLVAPQDDVVWDGGAAPFSTIASFDFYSTATNADLAQFYQWTEDGAAISGATNASYEFPVVSATDSGSNFQCIVTIGSLSVTSTPPAALTVVPNNPADVAAYQNLVNTTPGVVAYFPVDNCIGTVVTNVIDATHNGALENDASYDGRTNRSFGQRALLFDGNADVEVQNNPAYEFAGGSGTIEALVYLSQAPAGNAAIFSENFDQSAVYYSLQTDPTGSFLIYTNDQLTTALTWSVPGGLLGQFLDIALVIDSTTNVTPYVDGQSLGTQQQPSFGGSPGGSFWIGGIGDLATANRWIGTVDELSIYGTNLPLATIQAHYTKFVFGTNVVPPVVTSQSTGKTVLAGGSPQLTATVTGGLPLVYQWTSNSFPIPGATTATLVLSNSTTNFSATYSLSVSNVFGSTNTADMVMTFVAPSPGYEATVMNDHPTAFWRLADTSGPTAFDSAGLNDAIYSGSGVTYATGGPTFDSNAGALFDGSSGRAVTPANFPDLNPNGPFTIEFWANLTAYASIASDGHYYSPMSSMPRPSRTGGWEFYMGGNSDGYEFHTVAGGGYNMLALDNNEPPPGAWWYVTGVWDGSILYLYVNGQLGNVSSEGSLPNGEDTWELEGASPFTPNTSVPYYIGSRSDGVDYFDGAMADIAFYDYALSYQQITNHWSAAWLPATVSAPSGLTNVEGTTLTIAPVVTGLPNTYQWFFNGSALSTTAVNSDGSPHYPIGVTSSSLEITQVEPVGDSGTYYLAITNPLGDINSSNIAVVITPNTNPPTIVSVTALATPPTAGTPGGTIPFVVKALFSARIDATTGGNVANYSLGTNVTISKVTLLGSGPNDVAAESLGADWREALLVTTGLTPGQQYGLTVSGLKDQSQTPLTIPTTTTSFTAPVLTTGMVNWDYYYLGNSQGGIVSALQGDPNYQAYAPQTNSYLTALDTDQITGGDLNNNPIFGSLGDNYGDVTSGWITPTVTTNYTFFLWTDDAGELDLSTDSNPANISAIATEATAGSGFVETNSNAGGQPTEDSNPILLTAGQSYYIQVLHAEGGGGDYAKVAWRMQGDPTPAQNLSPIPGAFLSTYAPPATAPQFGTLGLTNGTLTLNWSGGTIQQSTDLLNWTNVPGNPSPLNVSVNSTTNTLFFRLVEP